MPNGKLPKKPTGPSFGKGLLVWLIILVIVIVVFNFSNMPTEQVYELNYTQFLSLLDKGSVKSVVMKEYAVYTEVPYADFVKVGGKVKPIFQWGRQVQKPKKVRVKVVVPNDPDLIKILKEKGVQIYVKPPEKPPWYMNFLSNWLPLIILIGLWIFFMRQMQAGSGRAFTFGKSRARFSCRSRQKDHL